jgi:PII-like signaling protein
LTFFTEQNRKHGHQSICNWLLKFAEQRGALDGTLMTGAEGFDHAGKFHSAGFSNLSISRSPLPFRSMSRHTGA